MPRRSYLPCFWPYAEGGNGRCGARRWCYRLCGDLRRRDEEPRAPACLLGWPGAGAHARVRSVDVADAVDGELAQ